MTRETEAQRGRGLCTATPLVQPPLASLLVLAVKDHTLQRLHGGKDSCASLLPVAVMEHGPEALRRKEFVLQVTAHQGKPGQEPAGRN